MNKEQAIEIIETHSENISSSSLVGRALDIAIDALKAQLSKEGTTSDLISRQAVINAIENTNAKMSMPEWDEITNAVMSLPTIQPEQCGDKSYTLWKESYEELKRRMDELTSCSDIISRQAALDAVSGCGICTRKLVDLPTVQPEPHEGRWIRRDCGLDVECKCSKCGYRDFVEPRDEYWFKRNYCPNCGAKMKGAQNG